MGLSQVLGRVLEQLSVTAWLPAAVLVGTVAVLIELNTNDEADSVIEAIGGLASVGSGGVFVLAFSLVIATTMTQSAEFSAIRLLEGYWGAHPASALFCDPLIRRQEKKRKKLRKGTENAKEKALISACEEWKRWGLSDAVTAAALTMAKNGTDQPPGYTEDTIKDALKLDWLTDAAPEKLHRLSACRQRWLEFPKDKSRLMPTHLGNILRSAEDRIELPEGEELRGFVIRNLGRIPADLLAEHDSYRNRLDMYCIMTLICALLAVASPVCLLVWEGSCVEAVCAGGLYVLLAVAAYRAAAMSASSYGTVLIEIGRALKPGPDASPHCGRGSRAAPRL